MEFTKLNTNWDAEPNAPMPKVFIEGNADSQRVVSLGEIFIRLKSQIGKKTFQMIE